MKFPPRTITLPDGATVTLRAATPDDAAAVVRFRQDVVARCPYVLTVPEDVADLTPEQQAADLKRFADAPHSLMLLALHDADLLSASGLFGFDRAKKRHTADLGMAIAEPWRGRGLGRVILETLVAWARANPAILRLTLDVMADNTRARRMYELAGFRPCAHERRAYLQPDGSFADAIKMDLWVG